MGEKTSEVVFTPYNPYEQIGRFVSSHHKINKIIRLPTMTICMPNLLILGDSAAMTTLIAGEILSSSNTTSAHAKTY